MTRPEPAPTRDPVADAIREIEEIDHMAGVLRRTAPAAAASMGDLTRRLRRGAVCWVPSLTAAEWCAAADEHQARFRPGEDGAPPDPPAPYSEEWNL